MLGNEWVLALVCVVTFYGAGAHEGRFGGHNHGTLWAALSILVSALVVLVCKGTWTYLLLAQAGLLVGIAVFRVLRDPS
jgi:hypothetical protein